MRAVVFRLHYQSLNLHTQDVMLAFLHKTLYHSSSINGVAPHPHLALDAVQRLVVGPLAVEALAQR